MIRFLLVIILISVSLSTQASKKITGRVFLDLNKNGVYEKNEPLLQGVSISNGRDIVKTDKHGAYFIDKIQDLPLFIIQPKGYRVGLKKNNVADFYYLLNDQEQESNNSFDFALYKQDQQSCKIALLGDLQVDSKDDLYHLEKLVVQELVDQKPDLVFPLGDLSFDNLEIFSDLSESLSLIGSPVYYVIGNHDLDFTNWQSENKTDQSFKTFFGPSYYALEYDRQLILVLNNIYASSDKDYIGRIGNIQKKFIENLLAMYKDKQVDIKIMMHIPIEFMEDKKEFIALFDDFSNVFVATGHTHTQYHKYFERQNKAPIHQLVAGAVCGAWWQGPHDLYGIPFALMYDGTKKGYWFLNQKKHKQTLQYKVSGESINSQMHIWTPEYNTWDKSNEDLNTDEIIVNVFAGDSATLVEVSFDNLNWIAMDKHQGVDPFFQRLLNLEQQGKFKSLGSSKIGQVSYISDHLWSIKIPDTLKRGKHLIQVKVYNPFLSLDHLQYKVLDIN